MFSSQGNGIQREAARLSQTAEDSRQLLADLENDEEITFDIKDAVTILNFHNKVRGEIAKMNAELDKINRDLAVKYKRDKAQ